MSATLTNWIGGQKQAASAGKTLDNICPATNTCISTIPRSGAVDIDNAVAAARKALKGPWRTSTAAERAGYLETIANTIEARLEEFAQAESRDTGKPVALAKSVDIPRAIANFRFFAGAIRHDETGCHSMPDAINYTVRKPVGIVGLITPWNLPLYLLTWKTAPALAMGNTIIAKPSELTPTTATLLAEVIHEAGVPAGVFNLVHGLGQEAGQAIVGHPAIRGVSFTGGTTTGAHVAASAAPHFKKLSLELGGKNATLVFDDCDLDKAVSGALRAAFANQGQICLCGSRILVQEGIYDAFVERFTNQAKGLTVGDPTAASTNIGAVISQAHRDKVEQYVAVAREEGGTVVAGGKRPTLNGPFADGAFFEPTVITDVDETCRITQEEVFGPLVTIQRFSNADDAVRIANTVRYGLSASVWTGNLDTAHKVSARLDTGMVWVNTWLHRDLRVPFGGVKDSGVGREGGTWSLEFFSEAQNICVYLGDN
ncbi:MAG: 2-hydroxymuconic semialdehyde dehydrogenase [Myxococcales bacterium]|nr:2-hydroxymuconic semialdehyde dehydrogenase [Myxococcales bacterium]